MGPEAKNEGGSRSDISREAWPLDVAESRPTQPPAFDPKASFDRGNSGDRSASLTCHSPNAGIVGRVSAQSGPSILSGFKDRSHSIGDRADENWP